MAMAAVAAAVKVVAGAADVVVAVDLAAEGRIATRVETKKSSATK
jgi:hypothetical protein